MVIRAALFVVSTALLITRAAAGVVVAGGAIGWYRTCTISYKSRNTFKGNSLIVIRAAVIDTRTTRVVIKPALVVIRAAVLDIRVAIIL